MRLIPFIYTDLVQRALKEDLAGAGDVTTDAVIAPDHYTQAVIVSRSAGRICGLPVALTVFQQLDPDIVVSTCVAEGEDVTAGINLAVVSGRAQTLLSAERVALNILARLCGIATATRDVVNKVADYPCHIVCTRKTTPGLRALEKYAVHIGGGKNHRFGLYDAVLIKDNHLLLAGSIAKAVASVRAQTGHMVKIAVEVDDLVQLEQALAEGVDSVLLDNMSLAQLRDAVGIAQGRVITEASGNVTPHNVADIAATGVDLISMGWLTHSAPALDVALDLQLGRTSCAA